ncbi:hypothetical protein V8E53_011862 [Lactarius tabidus]
MSSTNRSSPSTHRGHESTQPTSEPEEEHPTPKNKNKSNPGKIPAIEACGRFLLRCVHPFVAADILMVVAREQVSPGSSRKYRFLTKETMEVYGTYSAAALSFSEEFQTHLEQKNLENVESSLARGISQGRSWDLIRLKEMTPKLASKTNVPLPLVSQTKSDRGFNDDETGQMLIPIRNLKAYNKDPIGVRAKVNAGSEEFRVTGTNPPAFLYEDPDNYDSKNSLSGLMRGYFLGRCLRAIFSGPRTSLQLPTNGDRPTSRSVSEHCGLKSVTTVTMVYVAMVARHTLSTQNTWSGKDGTFDYQDFAGLLFKLFELDEEWTKQTIRHWNLELFGDEDGAGPDRQIAGPSDPDDFLAMVKDQSEGRRTRNIAAEEARSEDADPHGDGDSRCSEPPGDGDDLDFPTITRQTPLTSRTEDSRQTTPDEDRTEDSRPLTPLPDPESDEDLTEDSRPLTPLPEFESDEDRTLVVRPVPKKRYGKQKDNGTGDQAGNEMQPRAAKRCKTATCANPQAKPKPRPRPKRRLP